VVGGWSFLVMILPYIEEAPLYGTLQIRGGDPTNPSTFSSSSGGGGGSGNYALAASTAMSTSIRTFVCPSNPNHKYQDNINNLNALTNYKAMGATCVESLNCCLSSGTGGDYPGKPNTLSQQPDGALYPSANGCRSSDITDGTSHTILCVETMDDTQSVWTFGTDVTVVGLPTAGNNSSTSGSTPVTFALPQGGQVSYYAPQGFTPGQYDTNSTVTQGYRTYLAYNFAPSGQDAGTYLMLTTGNTTVIKQEKLQPQSGSSGSSSSSTSNSVSYGPSSAHSIVNHLLADGSVQGLNKEIDVAAYMFMITKAAGDPNDYQGH
jgi:hypothetical protein